MKYIVEILTFFSWPVMLWFSFWLSVRLVRHYDRRHPQDEKL